MKNILSIIIIIASLNSNAQTRSTNKLDSTKRIQPIGAGKIKKNLSATGTYPKFQSTSNTVQTIQTKATVPGTTQPQPAALTDNDYYLSVVKVTIKTGADNKEYPSSISIDVGLGNKTGYYSAGENSFGLHYFEDEIKVNSTRDLFIPKENSNYDSYILAENTLSKYKQNGLCFLLRYQPNILLDAWKIESILLTLQFKDANGNPHPTMGNKIINISNTTLWMDGFDKETALFTTDNYFNPLPVRQLSSTNYIKYYP